MVAESNFFKNVWYIFVNNKLIRPNRNQETGNHDGETKRDVQRLLF